jgi:hypothetical protein
MARRAAVVALTLLATVLGGRALAQETPAPEAPKPEARPPEASSNRPTPRAERGPTAMLRVQLVLTRYQGEKKTGSLPYTFTLAAGADWGDWVRMRMGVDTPVPVGPLPSPKAQGEKAAAPPPPPTSFQYRNVGTNIDCRAIERGDGRYELNLSVENSSALSGIGEGSEASLPGVPLFRRFEAHSSPVLRDGQSVQVVASTDPVTGEVVKIDVTMNVVK